MFGGEQKGMFAMGGEEAKKTLDPLRKAAKEAKAELDDIRNRIKVQEQAQPELGEAPKKTYQQALKEKQEEEKKQTRQFAGEKAAITRKVIEEANKIEPSDARSVALKYLTGGKLSWDAIDEVAGRVKSAKLNTGEREFKSEEARSRDYVAKQGEGEDLEGLAHNIWDNLSEEMQSKMDTQKVKDALMRVISEYNSKAEAAQALIDGYKEVDLDAEEDAFYERYNITEDEVDAELAKLEPTLDRIGDDDYNFGKVPDEHINNLIEQYETEIERQAEQPSEGGEEKIAEKISAREAGKPEEAKSVEEAYKDLTKIEKRQIINSKFDELLKELKIEKICPTD